MRTRTTLRQLLAALVLLSATALPAAAQDEIEIRFRTDVMTKYMWRGIEKAGLSVQPRGVMSWKGFSLEAWANAPLDQDDAVESNLKLGYRWKGLNVGVLDYWTKGVDPENRYFYYNNQNGPHNLEANVGYTCELGSVQAYTQFFGPDQRGDGKRAYSTIVEVAVPFSLSWLDCEARLGLTAFESKGTREYYTVTGITSKEERYTTNALYATGPACVMASVRAGKKFQIGNDMSVPVFWEVHTNPYRRQAALLMGVAVTFE